MGLVFHGSQRWMNQAMRNPVSSTQVFSWAQSIFSEAGATPHDKLVAMLLCEFPSPPLPLSKIARCACSTVPNVIQSLRDLESRGLLHELYIYEEEAVVAYPFQVEEAA